MAGGFTATVAKVTPYLSEDLKALTVYDILDDTRRRKFFGSDALRPDQVAGILAHHKLGQLFTTYENSCGSKREDDTYGPLVNLVNKTLALVEEALETEPSIRICRNDPRLIPGCLNSQRKPDLVGLSADRAPLRAEKGRVETKLDLTLPRTFPLQWREVEFFIEVKRKKVTGSTLPDVSSKRSMVAGSESVRVSTQSPPDPFTTGFKIIPKSKNRHTRQSSGQKRGREDEDDNDNEDDNDGARPSQEKKRRGEDGAAIRPQTKDENSLEEQMMRYAIDALSADSTRTHVFGLFIRFGELRLFYFDRSGYLAPKSPIDIRQTEGRRQFVLLLAALATAKREQLGHVGCMELLDWEGPSVRMDPEGQKRFKLVLKTDTVVLGPKLSSRPIYGLMGRATRVFYGAKQTSQGASVSTADCDLRHIEEHRRKGDGRDPVLGDSCFNYEYAVKMSWPNSSRKSEVEILARAKEYLQKLDAARLPAKEEGTDVIGELAARIPVVSFHEDIDQLSKLSAFRDPPDMDRTLRVIGFDVLEPIHNAKTIVEFWDAYLDIFQVLNFLWDQGIEHCDISMANLMMRRNADGSVCGVLNDWDLARVRTFGEERTVTPGTRTGTQPFMAYELLRDENRQHLKRHDFESMLYVLIWCCSRFDGPDSAENDCLQEWCNGCVASVANGKFTLLADSTVTRRLRFTPWFAELYETVQEIVDLFRRGYVALESYNNSKEGPRISKFQLRRDAKIYSTSASTQSKPWRKVTAWASATLDEETLCGNVTFKTIWERLVDFGVAGKYQDAKVEAEASKPIVPGPVD